jgi:sugar phosphate isomerase/epimerase
VIKPVFALSTWLYQSQPLEAALKAFAETGFRDIEIWGDMVHLDPRINPDIEEVARLVSQFKLHVHSVHSPYHGLNIGSQNLAELKQAEQWLVKSLQYAARMAAKVLVVHPLSFNFRTGSNTSLEATQELVGKLVKLADGTGVTITIENLPVAPPAYTSLESLSELFPDPRIGFCIDIGHAHLNHKNVISEIKAVGSRLASSHISNNDGQHDFHNPPQEGTIDVRIILEELMTLQVTPVLEVNGHKNPDTILDILKVYRDQR